MSPTHTMSLPLSDLKALRPRRIVQPEALEGRALTGVSTDSRTLSPGSCSWRSQAKISTGIAFAAQAQERGAVAVIVERPVAALSVSHRSWWTTRLQLCRGSRAITGGSSASRFIAIGGSNGKTTTKEMIAAVLRTDREILSTAGI